MTIHLWQILVVMAVLLLLFLVPYALAALGRALFDEPTPRTVRTTSGDEERTRIRNGLLRLEHWTDADGYWWVSVGDVLNVIDGSE